MTYISTIFKVGQEILYTKSGLKFFNVDPLVFDLTGNGINLTPVSTAAPMLDMQGTGFAVHSGWVEPGEGVLVLQQPGEDGTPNVTEMFGGSGARVLPRWRNTMSWLCHQLPEKNSSRLAISKKLLQFQLLQLKIVYGCMRVPRELG